MPRKQKKYHFIYKTTNLLNEKFYVGMHSTDNLEDGYIGSGKRLRYSINKHGHSNHKFEILEFLPSREELKKREAEVVNEELLTNPLCMNLKFGGEGGWDHIVISDDELKKRQINGGQSFRQKLQNDPAFAKVHSNKVSKNNSLRKSKGFKQFGDKPILGFTGKVHSEETKEKMRKSKNVGEANSQFGKCWIFNDFEKRNMKIYIEDLDLWLKDGWSKGRKIKF